MEQEREFVTAHGCSGSPVAQVEDRLVIRGGVSLERQEGRGRDRCMVVVRSGRVLLSDCLCFLQEV